MTGPQLSARPPRRRLRLSDRVGVALLVLLSALTVLGVLAGRGAANEPASPSKSGHVCVTVEACDAYGEQQEQLPEPDPGP